jgi:hypothetical protein
MEQGEKALIKAMSYILDPRAILDIFLKISEIIYMISRLLLQLGIVAIHVLIPPYLGVNSSGLVSVWISLVL